MANRLHPNDTQRIHRALAVQRSTGQSLCSFWEKAAASKLNGWDFIIAVNDRKTHRERLASRVDEMIASGFKQECEEVLNAYGEEILMHPAIRSIGYKEMMAHCCKELAINDVRNSIITATAQFVKRQMTWVNSWDDSMSTRIDLYDDKKGITNLTYAIVETLVR